MRLYLPVFAGTYAAFSVAEVEKLENLLLGNLVLCVLLMLVLIFSMLLAALARQLLAAVLLQNFKPAAKPLTFLPHKDSLLVEGLLFEGFGIAMVGPVWVVVVVLAPVEGCH